MAAGHRGSGASLASLTGVSRAVPFISRLYSLPRKVGATVVATVGAKHLQVPLRGEEGILTQGLLRKGAKVLCFHINLRSGLS
jgi:hypothetical protein